VMSSFYNVLVDGKVVSCRPRGRFKIESQEVLAGDSAFVRLLDDGTGYIEAIHERRNSLSRPPVANIDMALIVFTFREPPLNLDLLDRVIVHAMVKGVRPVLVLNKVDQCTDQEVASVASTYRDAGLPLYAVSAKFGLGVDALRTCLSGGISVLAGQSGVGKSRLMNSLVPGAGRKIGEISERLLRGKHTTRHCELVELPGGGFLVDTPGFTLLEQAEVGLWELSSFFPEIHAVEAECRFTDCLHITEPECAVKARVENGTISKSRYDHYVIMLKELKEAESRRYT
jgi:ribosome biogenesis GTPase / thiamine phosphate phosphatase